MSKHEMDAMRYQETERRILVVDDDRDFLDSLTDILKQQGYTVKKADSVSSANQAINDFDSHVALVDLRLGRSNGMDLIGHLMEMRPDILCLIVTAYADVQTAIDALHKGVYDYLRKPVHPHELFATLDRCFDKLKLEREKRAAEAALKHRNRELEEINARLRKIVTSASRITADSGSGSMSSTLMNEFAYNANADGGCLYLMEEGSLVLYQSLNIGNIPNQILLPIPNDGLFERAIRDGRPILIENIGAEDLAFAGKWKGFQEGSVLIFPLANEKGDITGIVTINRRSPPPFSDKDVDIGAILASYAYETIRATRATEALIASEARYRLFSDNVTDVIWTADLNMKYTYVSPSIRLLRGFTKEEAMDQTLDEMLVPESRRICEQILEEEMAQERVGEQNLFRSRTIELDTIRRDGSIVPVEVKVTFQRDSQGRPIGIIGVTRDISERKKAEEEKARIESQLLQAQKMEAVGILAGGVAHDFNNLLTTILGNTDLAMMNLRRSDPSNVYLKQVQQASTRAADLTRQLLLFSRRQPMEHIPLNLSRTVENMLKMLKRLIGEDISIGADCDPDLWTVKADEGNTEQVLMNLSVNARDAMPEGGSIHITTENVVVDLERCKTMPDARPGKYVRLSVADTGVGMDSETLLRIFEPFFTTKGAGAGTGLGLSVVYGIVKEHDGWIEVVSEQGKGTTFRICMPAVPLKVEEKTDPIVPTQELKGHNERILLVEDEDGVREFATRALRKSGYVVFECGNAKEGLDIFKKENGDFQLVFSDVVLPGENGVQLVTKLLGRKPGLRVLLCSGYTDQKSHRQIVIDKGFPFLQKPYSVVNLLKTVKEILAWKEE
ncbi:MAG: response regulator [Desulfatiglans sp.]|nr:response regulator [Thermodesulfobacteriota bacterium]MEE4352367.1 response regulator [Desulfatiglans sp.]